MKSSKKDRNVWGGAFNLKRWLRKRSPESVLAAVLILATVTIAVSPPYFRGILFERALVAQEQAQPAPEDELRYALTITSDYTLKRDIGPCYEGGILIAADNITLDGNGHKIIGVPTTGSVGMYLKGRKGVTIKNCDVSNFVMGVVLRNCENITFRDNNIHDNDDEDPEVGVDDGMTIYNLNNSLFVNNTIANNGGQGIHFSDSSHNILMNNTFKDNRKDGVYIRGGTHNTLINNTVTTEVMWPQSAGYRISKWAQYNVLLNNSATGTYRGFYIWHANHNIVKGGFFDSMSSIGGDAHDNTVIDIKLIRSGGAGLRFDVVESRGAGLKIPHNNTVLGGVIKGCDQGIVFGSAWGNKIIGLKFIDCDVQIFADSEHGRADNTLINTVVDMDRVQLDEKSILKVLP